ncbi:hypothetical protein ACQKKX_04535 [Neorhizobium sp. NPDC001467]|uniref:hypothetical protein n=1 Tax=Neorhizobium sp. NPDC001467 TaxID=3390595 RepID=UPI003D051DCC
MSTVSYRLPMPLVDVNQAFANVAELEDVLVSLHKRAMWFLSTRSSVEVDEEYADLGVYVWSVKVDEEFVTHVELAERRHAISHYPEDALWLAFDGVWTLRRVEEAMNSDNWIASFLALGVDQYLGKFTGGGLH